MSVKLTLKGFDRYLEELRKAGANLQKESESVLLESAAMFDRTLQKHVDASPMSEDTKKAMKEDRIKPQIAYSSDYFVIAEAGFRMGEYDPDDLSGGFIAQFNEYGTGRRHTRKGENRGSLEAMEFTRRAHKEADPKIRKMQKALLEEALKGLRT